MDQRKVEELILVPERILMSSRRDQILAGLIATKMTDEAHQETTIATENLTIDAVHLEGMAAITILMLATRDIDLVSSPKRKGEGCTTRDLGHQEEAWEVEVYLSRGVEVDHSSTIESDLNSTTARRREANGRTTTQKMTPPEMISKDLRDQATILATGSSAWTNLETNQSRNFTTELPTKSKKRGMKGSSREIKETDHLKSSSLKDEL